MTIEIISGSARQESITLRVALALKNWLTEKTSHTIGLIDCRTINFPPLQQVFTSVDNTPDEYKNIAEKIFNADAFIWVSPEYNGSFTPALKNLIDHFPKILHKAVGVVSASYGALGGMRAAQQMISYAVALFGVVSPQLLIIPKVTDKFDAEGNITDESFQANVHNFITEFLWLAEKITSE